MGKKSKTKNKISLSYYEHEVDGKIIDLRRFAYDYLAYSTQKFGLPAMCIKACELAENDYPYSDFIVVMSRMMFRLQVTHRTVWYPEFQKQYELTRLDSFENVKKALGSVFNLGSGEIRNALDVALTRRLVYLSIISDFILFLYTANCNSLYFGELPEFWTQYSKSDTKLFVKHGGLAHLYRQFNTPEDQSDDLFFNDFIPKHCIPYNESSRPGEIYYKEQKDFFKPALSIIEELNSLAQSVFVDSLTQIANAPEQDGASGTSITKNTGLGIPPHEILAEMFGSKLDIEAETSPQSVPSTSQRVRNRKSSNRKENLERTPSSRASEKPVEKIEADLPGATSALVMQNIPVSRHQENPRGYTESIRRDGQKASSLLAREDIERVTSSFVGNAPSQYSPGTSSQGTLGHRKKSTQKKKRKSRLPQSGDQQQSDIGGAPSSVPPQIPPATSRPETIESDASTIEEELKQLNLGSSKRKTSNKKQK